MTTDRLNRQRSPLARPTINRVILGNDAARAVKAWHVSTGVPYTSANVASYVSAQLLPQPGAVRALLTNPAAVLYWLEQARGMCIDETAQRDLDALIAAVMVTGERK